MAKERHYRRFDFFAYFAGGLSAGSEARLERHLASCEDCAGLARMEFRESNERIWHLPERVDAAPLSRESFYRQIHQVLTGVLRAAMPEQVENFKLVGGQLIRTAAGKRPFLGEFASQFMPASLVRRPGVEALISGTLGLLRERPGLRSKEDLEAAWRRLLIQRGFNAQEAADVAARFGAELAGVMLPGVRDAD